MLSIGGSVVPSSDAQRGADGLYFTFGARVAVVDRECMLCLEGGPLLYAMV